MNSTEVMNKKNIADILKLGPLQEGILFHYLSDTTGSQYFEQLSLNVSGMVDSFFFREAWKAVVQANEMLRTVFSWQKLDQPVQIILKEVEIPVQEHDLTAFKGDHLFHKLETIKASDRTTPFNLRTGPLFRINLCKLAKDQYEIIISNHHIIYDGWSTGIILKDFFRAYGNLLEGHNPVTRKQGCFKDYIKWLSNQDSARQNQFWSTYLQEFDTRTLLPRDLNKQDTVSTIQRLQRIVPEDLQREISNLAKSEKITMSAFFYTVWGILLQKYNNIGDIVVGTTVSGRPADLLGVEDVVGLYINTIPLRVKAKPTYTVKELLNKIQKDLQERQNYECTPLSAIKSCSELRREDSLFDSIIVVENYPLTQKPESDRTGLYINSYTMEEMTNYSLVLEINTFDNLEISFSYDKTMFSEDAIKRLAEHFLTIVQQMATKLTSPLSSIEMLLAAEKKRILEDFTAVKNPSLSSMRTQEFANLRDQTVVTRFEYQVARYPELPAVSDGKKTLTYYTLNRQADQLAHRLRALGVKADTIVALLTERSVEMVVGIMAILKAGGAYLPINPGYPTGRIMHMLEDSGSQILLTQPHLKESMVFAGEVLDLYDVSLYNPERLQDRDQCLNSRPFFPDPAHLAYVIYTSGSTGKPKGVLIEHQALSNFMNSIYHNFDYQVGPGDHCLSLTNVSFDVSVCEIFLPLVYGARLVLLEDAGSLDVFTLTKTLLDESITFAYIPPTLLKDVQSLLQAKIAEGQSVQLNKILVGVEPIKDSTLEAYLHLNPQMQILNGYGPTEATICATMHRYKSHVPVEQNVSIGQPLLNTQIYILDPHGQLAPVGVGGELCISGAGLARGYLNLPEVTQEHFIPNPFFPGARMYLTGDRARWLPDGNLEFLGRTDLQVKIRGFRIELGEIESGLLQHAEVREAAVLARKDSTGQSYLGAYYTANRELPLEELRAFLQRTLPDYMIPSYFLQMDQLPITPSGKLDRKALPEVGLEQVRRKEYVAPTNELEEKLAKIWASLLQVKQVGIHDHFFDLGGHSLKATSLITRIHRELQIEVPVQQVFKTPTISTLATYLRQAQRKEFVTIARVEERAYYPTSSAQKRMFVINRLEPEDTSYNISGTLRIAGELDYQRLIDAFQKLVQRHESLRTSFELVKGEPVQKIHVEVELPIEMLSLDRDQHQSQDLHSQEHTEDSYLITPIMAKFIKPFDLKTAPLCRVGLVRLSEQHLLLIDMHHIISDGVSMGLLMDELIRLYAGENLVEPLVRYRDFTIWQNNYLDSPAIQVQEKYWLEEFADEVPVLELPNDFPRTVHGLGEGAELCYVLPPALVADVRAFAAREGTTLYMVLLAIYSVLLAKYTAEEDIVVGSPIAGRSHADLEGVIGMFVNTLALRNRPSGEKTFCEFLCEVHDRTLQAFANQDYPFERLIDRLQLNRDLQHHPLFNTVLVLQNTIQPTVETCGLQFTPIAVASTTAKFDLTLNFLDWGTELQLGLEYRKHLFTIETMQRFYQHFLHLCREIVEDPQRKLSALQLLSSEERQQILIDFNRTEVAYPADRSIQQLFEAQVARTPDQIAIVNGERSLTYAELNRRANRLARKLCALGVQRDETVGITANHSLEVIIGVLAIVKAGAAYLPIDLGYPEERIQFMLEDTNTRIMLVQGEHGEVVEPGHKLHHFRGIIVNLEEEPNDRTDDTNLPNTNQPHDLIYVIYTSGSTGKPKGVLVTHQNVNRLISNSNMLVISPVERILQVATVSFDASTFEIWGSFLNGATLYQVGKETVLSPTELERKMHQYGISMVFFTAALFNQLLDKNPAIFSRLKILYVGGDIISVHHLCKLQTLYPALNFINGYGPTECTTFATFYRVESKWDENQNLPIGIPLVNTTAYIFDKDQNVVPIGVPGELYLGGDGVARGYLKRPELTAEKFVSDPFRPGHTMYRTGDLVRWRPDGNIEILGRIDQQVKIRGFRIELGEIENCLLQHVAIKEAVVIVRKDESENKYLCAYVVGESKKEPENPIPDHSELVLADREDGTQLTSVGLRTYLAEKLPDYMIPSYFVQLVEMPLNQNGKIDRRALPEPALLQNLGVDYIAPANHLEEQLAAIWAEILGVPQVGTQDNFFALGGHSLKATALTARVVQELGVELPLREIFKTPTVQDLARYIANQKALAYTAIEPVPVNTHYPLSAAQKRMYIIHQMDPVSTTYNIPAALYITGTLQPKRLQQCLQELVNRHESLRTSFSFIAGEPVQIVHPTLELAINHRVVAQIELDQEMATFIRPFHLNQAPLIRAELLQFSHEQYVLLLDMHHIISDGVSMSIILMELKQLYAGEKLEPLHIQYKDFAVWQSTYLQSEQVQGSETYWLQQFAGEIPVLNLPTDFPRPAIRNFRGEVFRFRISQELTNQLTSLTLHQGVTLYMTLLAAYHILLARYSGQEDIITGSPVAGRTQAELSQVVGMFVNTLALRTAPVGTIRFREYLQQVKETVLSAQEHGDYQFEMLVERLPLERDLSRNPLFDTIFSLQNTDLMDIVVSGLEFRGAELAAKSARADLSLIGTETKEGLQFVLEYSTDLFTQETMARFSKHFVNLLHVLVSGSDRGVAEYELLNDEERIQLLHMFNDTWSDYPRQATVQQIFAKQVLQSPDHLAVCFEDETITYTELDRKSNLLAAILREQGIQRGEIVGFTLDRSLEMIISLVAILKAGGAYMPIDLAYPENRIKLMLEDAQVKIIIGSDQLPEGIGFTGEVINPLDISLSNSKNIGSSEVTNINEPHDLCNVIYTSGSTGLPKGVMIEHTNVIRLVKDTRYLTFEPEDRLLQAGSLTFDASTFEIWGTLLNGATLYLTAKENFLNPDKLAERLHQWEISVMFLTAALFNQMVEYDPCIFRGLRKLYFGGDKASPKHVNLVRKHLPDLELQNSYGPTEVTTFTSCCRIQDNYEYNVPIGRPISNTYVYVLDHDHHLQPIGVRGELYISGDGVARGYLNRSELTEEKFIENPFRPGERMYRTGDIVRWLPDGNLEFIGRIDNQVKIRGFRIEPGEIEAQLMKHDAVKEALVLVRQDSGGNKYLCAYVVVRDVEIVSSSELKAHLTQALPDYMIPAYFVLLDQFPLNSNGKIDRQALPEPMNEVLRSREYVPPITDTEKAMAALWSEILGVESVGIDDNFFELGGHSLRATTFVTRVYKERNVNLPLQQVFKTPTIRELAKCIASGEEANYGAIPTVESRDVYPVSSAQRRLLILDQLEEINTSYNVTQAMLVEGFLDLVRLEAAIQKLVERHEPLRTSFAFVEGEPVQRVHSQTDFHVQYWDGDNEQSIKEQIEQLVQPFDLTQAPLMRVSVIRLTPERHVLVFDIHHIIADGTSTSILIQDFVALYEGREIAPLRIQYKDFSVWQNSFFTSKRLRAEEEFWLTTFAGEIPVLNLPTDFPRPSVMNFAGGHLKCFLDPELTGQIQRLANNHGATLYMVLLAAFNVLLARYSGQDDIVIGSPIAGRQHADLAHIVGMFVNTLPMRNYLYSNLTFSEFLAGVRDRAVQAYENQNYQFEMLVDQLEIPRTMSRNPLFDVMLVLQNLQEATLETADLRFTPYEFDTHTAKFDLLLAATEANGGIELGLEYSKSLFKHETVERLAGHLKMILLAVTTDPATRLAEIDLLSWEEKAQLLQFNATECPFSENQTIHQLFEAQVAKTPDERAVYFEGERLTYQELNTRANQLAHLLRRQGIGPDQIVGMMLERSLEMVISVLAVLKAGSAILPIAPDLPEQRISSMLEDSNAILLLTSRKVTTLSMHPVTLFIDELGTTLVNESAENLPNVNTPDHLLYLITTSGSTGKPKSVMLEHRNLVNLINFTLHNTNIDLTRVLQFATLSFDVSFQEIFSTLLAGGELYMVSKERRDNVFQLMNLIRDQQITSIFMPVAYIKFIFGEEELRRQFPTSVRHIITAGEQLLVTNEFRQYLQGNGIYLHNHYGPSETHVATTLTLDHSGEIPELPAIGRPIANTQIYIVSREMSLQPVGVQGELLIAGECVGRGYLNRSELTAEKYISNPFTPGVRMYRTGDLARWLPDGTIEFLGRADFQVKIRGFRVELGEIETQLLNHPMINEAAVIDRQDHLGNKYLCAYLVVEGQDAEIGAEETSVALNIAGLKAFLAKVLPEYMIPTHFVLMEQIPLNANGKIDRKCLPEPLGERDAGCYVAPTTEIEARLAALWKEILGVNQVGIHDNFFELGGHSLKATALVARIYKEFQVDLPLRQIFKTPTLQALAAMIQCTEVGRYTAIPVAPEQEFYPLSSAQRRLFVLHQMEKVNTTYNMPGAMIIEGELDVSRFEWVFQRLIERHEALRTSFSFSGGELMQRVHSSVEFMLTDLGVFTGDIVTDQEEIHQKIRNFVQPFVLDQAPLLRVGLLQYSNGYIMIFDMHHIISDGTSINILIREVATLYDGHELPPLRIQYKDFSTWQNELFQSGKVHQQEEFWLKNFQGDIPVLNLPFDAPRPALATFEGYLLHFCIDRELTAQIKQFIQEEEVTLYMFLLAAYTVLLSKYSGQDDIIIGSPVAGRPHADLQNVMGVFINTLAMRNYPSVGRSFKEFLKEVKEHALEAYENQDFQFEMLVEKLDLKRDLSRNPLFDTLFLFQNTDQAEKHLTGLKIVPYEYIGNVAKFDLTYSAAEEAGTILCAFEYRTSLFSYETMQRMAKHLVQLIRATVAEPGQSLGNLQILSAEERERLTRTFNTTSVTFTKTSTIPELIEEQVERTPEAIALIFGDATLTYREWNERANQLAWQLKAKGVEPDQIVGLALHRSFDLMIAMLAIMKAGGAYLPIDPEYPEDRIDYMLTDSGAQLLITENAVRENLHFVGEIILMNTTVVRTSENHDTRTKDSLVKFCPDELDQKSTCQNNLPTIAEPHHLAYVIYTSGSTGKPKGVMLEHRSVFNFINGVAQVIDFKPGMTLLSLTTISFDIFVLETWLPLSKGLTVVIGSEEEQITPERMNAALCKHHVDILQATPSRMHLLFSNGSELNGLANLQALLIGGEAFLEQLLTRLHSSTPARIYNMYGPTETTVWSTIKELTMTEEKITLGRPIANTRIYILDGNLQPVPEGVAGELYIAGAGLARGYLKKPELTAERFLPDPFVTGERMYRTGDLAYWDVSGEIHYLGRSDHQVKIRGFRIEPGEIIAELLTYPGVTEAAIIEGRDATGSYLCAYYVAAEELPINGLREHLGKTLPTYMIPAYFVALDQMPLTPNGKLDRQALPEPDDSLRVRTELVLPRNEIESKLVQLWAEALEKEAESIGVRDSFFDLGGNSISLLKLNLLLNEEFGVELLVTDLFKYNTIEELAEAFINQEDEDDDDESLKITF